MSRAGGSPKWAVFISGRGSNLQALLDQSALMPIQRVYSSKSSAPGLLRARRFGVSTQVLPPKIDWNHLHEELVSAGITHLFLAGFMKLLPADFVHRWEGRILNVHPSLLPAYPGLESFEKSYRDGAAMGVTVHVVTPEMDAGPRLFQKSFLAPQAQKEITQERAAFLLSKTEQRLVREAGQRWK